MSANERELERERARERESESEKRLSLSVEREREKKRCEERRGRETGGCGNAGASSVWVGSGARNNINFALVDQTFCHDFR